MTGSKKNRTLPIREESARRHGKEKKADPIAKQASGGEPGGH